MAKMQGYNPGLSNEMLTLWLKARGGLSCEEARELIDQVSELELEVAAGEEERSGMYTKEDMDEAATAGDSYAEGEKAGKVEGYKKACADYAKALVRVINPAWGRRPTKDRLVAELDTIIRQMREDDGGP